MTIANAIARCQLAGSRSHTDRHPTIARLTTTTTDGVVSREDTQMNAREAEHLYFKFARQLS